MTKLLNAVLLLITIIGLVLLIVQRETLAQVEAERNRLGNQFGVLELHDVDQYHVIRVRANDPYKFQWRCYVPANASLEKQCSFGERGRFTSTSGGFHLGAEHYFQCNFEFKSDRLFVYVFSNTSSSSLELGPQELRDFLYEHWTELEFKVMGDAAVDVAASDAVVDLMTIHVPKRLHQEMLQRVGKEAERFTREPLFRSAMGTPEAFAARAEAIADKNEASP